MKRIILVGNLVFLLVIMIVVGATAQPPATPDLSADELLQLREQSAEVLVVDVRTAREFYEAHIVRAINISSQASNQFRSLPLLLPRDKDIPLVFYCRGFT